MTTTWRLALAGMLACLTAEGVAWGADAAPAGEFIPSATGTISDNLPRPPLQPHRTAIYPKPGELIVQTTRLCGDGDVENYASSHTNWDVVHANTDKELGLVTGVFVRNGNSVSWFPAGAGKISAEKSVVKSLPSLLSGSDEPLMGPVVMVMKAVQASRGFKMPGADPVKGQSFLGAMICKTNVLMPSSQGAPPPKMPPKVRLPGLFAASVKGAVETSVDAALAAGNLTPLEKFALAVDATSLTFASGSGPYSASGDSLFNLGKRVHAMTYPLCGGIPCAKTDYVSKINATSEAKDLISVFNALQKSAVCSGVPGVVKPFPGEQWWWEPIPLQLTCQVLEAAGAFGTFGNSLLNANPAMPTAPEFDAQKKGLAALLLKAGLVQQAQLAFHKSFGAQANAMSCIPSSGPYIDKVMNSLTVGASLRTQSSVTRKASHPEGDFAINTYKSYYGGSAGDMKTIFGMGGESAPLFELLQGVGPDIDGASKASSGAIFLDMKIRALGCCGQEPCFC